MHLLKEWQPYAWPGSKFTAATGDYTSIRPHRNLRIESIDVLRGLVMVIMALDHVRDYFHKDAFIYSPTDLSKTDSWLFLTRWITHFCAPVFVFLAGISSYQYGIKKGRKNLAFFLWTRGLWLIFVELFVLSLIRTFNPSYPYFNLQVIWAIGVCMIALAAIIHTNRKLIVAIAIVLIVGHNGLDGIHVAGNGAGAFAWSVLHELNRFTFGGVKVFIHYPLLPWIGLMTLGYYFGRLYAPGYDAQRRRTILLALGLSAIAIFVNLRYTNWYGDPSKWAIQKNQLFTLFSFMNVTKYPPSLLYILITIGSALVFLSFAERPLNWITGKLAVFGRTAMFYYLAHLLLIHLAALVAARIQGFHFSDMILSTSVDDSPTLKGYGFPLGTVYVVWIGLVLLLYPICKWYDEYKRKHVQEKRWLSYL
jgi:uncharacterized membrane protein